MADILYRFSYFTGVKAHRTAIVGLFSILLLLSVSASAVTHHITQVTEPPISGDTVSPQTGISTTQPGDRIRIDGRQQAVNQTYLQSLLDMPVSAILP